MSYYKIPKYVFEKVSELNVIDVGFGAGPSCVAGKWQSYDPPVPFAEALNWLERYHHVLKRGHLRFENGSTLWIDSNGFKRYEDKSSAALPHPGILIHTKEDNPSG